jgi:hypothetical protein
MREFTRNNINADHPILPEPVWQRLNGIKEAIDARWDDRFSDDWIIDSDVQGETIRKCLQWAWICENEWQAKRCSGSGKDCCKISIWYHYNEHDTWQNAIWMQVNEKEIFFHSPLSNVPNQRKRFAVFSSVNLPILYLGAELRGYMGLPNSPTFNPEFNHQQIYRKQINWKQNNGNFPDYNTMIDRVLKELCFLCTK